MRQLHKPMEVRPRQRTTLRRLLLASAVEYEGEMITSKQERCNRWVWQYLTKRPHALTREIVGATTDYTEIEVTRAIEALVCLGYVARDVSTGGRGWVSVAGCVEVAR